MGCVLYCTGCVSYGMRPIRDASHTGRSLYGRGLFITENDGHHLLMTPVKSGCAELSLHTRAAEFHDGNKLF